MKKRSCLIVGISLLIGVAPAHAWRDTYDDCIIKNVTEGMSNLAINTIKLSCTRKYYDTAPHSSKFNLVYSSIEEYKHTDPEFYNWVKNTKAEYPQTRWADIIERWIDKRGFPKR